MSKKKTNKNSNTKKNSKKAKKGRLRTVIIFAIIVIAIAIGIITYTNRTEPSLALKQYFSYLSNKDYEAMYDLVITDMPKEDFISRVKNIYEGIEATNISITVTANSTSENNKDIVNITYTNSMNTMAGNESFINTAKMKLEGEDYKIIWDSSIIFPDLKDNQKVRVATLSHARGNIYDRNGLAIAKEGTAYQVGLVPGKMNDTTDLNKIAELLGISTNTIQNALNASYVTDDTFVPLRNISRENQSLKNEILTIKGIMVSDYNTRVYPYKEATSILTGYVQDNQGKTGLEYAYNDKLTGEDGVEIYIVNEDGSKVKTIQKKDVKNGEDIKLTIDVNIQNKIYEQFKDDQGAFVSINYNTGEILALVSTPSYDANAFSLGVTDEEWQRLQNDEKNPMYNRYLGTYAPGSSFKPIVGAIGLMTNSFTATEDFGRSGTKWQKDESWKDLYVTTLETYSGDANLENALVYSDNIYFAKAALKIGKSTLQSELNKLGFNEKLNFVQDVVASTYGSMDSEAAIANSGYGQSEILVNPLHMASIYSAIANGGNMMLPYITQELNQSGNNVSKIYKQNAISQRVAEILKQDLVQVVEKGTAKECKIEGRIIAGKTGTAEIKESQDDNNGNEIGWFNSFDEDGHLIISMVQNAKDLGGSHYVVKKVRNIYEAIN